MFLSKDTLDNDPGEVKRKSLQSTQDREDFRGKQMTASHVRIKMPKPQRVIVGLVEKSHIYDKKGNAKVGLRQDPQASVGAARETQACIARLLKMKCYTGHYCLINTSNDMPDCFKILMTQPCS